MKDIFSPFQSKQKIRQIVICSFIFMGMAVPFKVMVLIEGLTEVRPVNAVPVVAGLLLGPAGAWGCAIGNLLADGFGTFSRASVLGFVGNFVAAYLPYKLWHIAGKRERPNVKSHIKILQYISIASIAATATAILLACGLDVFFGNWIPRIFWIILLNDLGFPLFLGLPVLIVLTSEDSKMEITVPGNVAVPIRMKYMLLLLLLASEASLIVMIALGMKMSESLLMSITGGVFSVTLFGFLTTN